MAVSGNSVKSSYHSKIVDPTTTAVSGDSVQFSDPTNTIVSDDILLTIGNAATSPNTADDPQLWEYYTWRAACVVFPTMELKGCTFHFMQAKGYQGSNRAKTIKCNFENGTP